MSTYGDLQPNTYYLIQVDDESDIELVSVLMTTRETVLLRSYLPQTEDFFQYKDEMVYKLVEELDGATTEQFNALYPEPQVYSGYEEGEE